MCVIGYAIIALALVLFVQAQNVYPQLLLARLLFSIGASAASTMVTAVLPTMSFVPSHAANVADDTTTNGRDHAASITSDVTITPDTYRSAPRQSARAPQNQSTAEESRSSPRVAGYVGMFTGCGALIALAVFLPLSAHFQEAGSTPAHALQLSYYIVAGTAFALAIICFIGLRRLQSEAGKSWSSLFSKSSHDLQTPGTRSVVSSWRRLVIAMQQGFQQADISLGYLGGFVARASSVGISSFVPLLVNAAFLSSGLCPAPPDTPAGLPDIKRQCPRAYIVAAQLTGVSQLVALLFAPVFGYSTARYGKLPLTLASVAGIVGYPLFANQFVPEDHNGGRKAVTFLAVSLMGFSQIGAIVCSLSYLSQGILSATSNAKTFSVTNTGRPSEHRDEVASGPEAAATHQGEHIALLDGKRRKESLPLSQVKGVIAGIYSFYGGAAILILTKLGGTLFDKVSTGGPFYIMAAFNGCLLAGCLASGIRKLLTSERSAT